MSADPRKLTGAAAVAEIIERLKGFGADVEKALDGGATKQESFELDTGFGKMSGRFGLRVGPAQRPSRSPPRRNAAPKPPAEPLVNIELTDGALVVTTETDDPQARVTAEGATLTLHAGRAPARAIALPRRVKPDSLVVTIVNGILEARLVAEDAAE